MTIGIFWRRVCISFSVHLNLQKNLLMLVKMNLLFPAYARHERVKQEKVLTRKHWVSIDRIVMAALFISVIAGAIIFS